MTKTPEQIVEEALVAGHVIGDYDEERGAEAAVEALREAGMLAETEWEYGCAWDDGETQMSWPVEGAESHLRKFPEPNGRLVRRRKASEWEIVE